MRIRLRNGLSSISPHGSAGHRGIFPVGLFCLLLAVAGGCQTEAAKVASAEPPAVPVSQPIEREVTDYVEFTGQTKAVISVDVRPRVTGYLVKMPFKEGAEVKEGDLLFVVDPRPYKAQLDQAQSQVNLYQASLKLAKTTLARDRAVNAQVPGSISQQQFDQEQAVVDEADARVKAYEVNMELYRLNHEFTRVLSPIDGQIGQYVLQIGNLVNADQTLLTTVVSVDPMHVWFEMDEPTLLRIRRAVSEGKVEAPTEGGNMPVSMKLQGEEGYPHKGNINFVNNQVNSQTGSILVRGVFPNPLPKKGPRLLSPGMFARIRLPIGGPHKALLVLDRVLSSDQGLKFVYVVDAENKVQTRRITTGARQEDGMRVIESGIKPGDWIVTGGILQVRLRMVVRPDRVPMPTLGQPSQDDASTDQTTPPATKPTEKEKAKT
jgi:multidrug efflux system membrane fusion protein